MGSKQFAIMVGSRYVKANGGVPPELTVWKSQAEKFPSVESARVAFDRLTATQLQKAQIVRA